MPYSVTRGEVFANGLLWQHIRGKCLSMLANQTPPTAVGGLLPNFPNHLTHCCYESN